MAKRALFTTTGFCLAALTASLTPVQAEEISDRAFTRDAATAPDAESGLRLPDGFQAQIFADDLGRARHLAVAPNGDVYVNLRQAGDDGHGVVALRDGDGDGRAEVVERFGDQEGTGITVQGDYLYVASDDAVFRYARAAGELVPSGAPELMVSGFPDQRAHAAKAVVFDGAGHMYVNQGVPSNACQEEIRTPGSAGRQPCDEIAYTGIWRFPAGVPGLDQQGDGTQVAKGLRHGFAMDWNVDTQALFFVQHGRDQLNSLWPDHFDNEDNAEMPAEEFHIVSGDQEYGWPYTYFDPRTGKRFVAPEYGGDGEKEPEAGLYPDPLVAFPAHWGPNDMIFYTGDQFPEEMRGGALVAFHGSWNRAPLPQGGYNVVFVPFRDGMPTGEWSVFADGFKGADVLDSPRNALHRPTGLAQGPDGALYVADSVKGRIWKITYQGE